MTEREYIDATDCRSLGHVLDAMGAICAANQPVIDTAEFAKMKGLLYQWREKLFEKIKTTEAE